MLLCKKKKKYILFVVNIINKIYLLELEEGYFSLSFLSKILNLRDR